MIVFASGGSGGHIVPSLAVADELARLAPGVRCCVMHSTRAIDARVLSPEPWPHIAIPARPLNARPLKFVRGVCALPGAASCARRVLAGEHPEAPWRATHLVTLGGFVAAPAVLAARALGVPITMINIDAVAGLANRVLGRFAATRFAAAYAQPRWTTVPPIVRRAMLDPIDARTARTAHGLDPDRPTVLVTGGSLGARSLNRFVLAFAEHQTTALDEWQILHQAGELDHEDVRACYERLGVRARAVAFLDSFARAWRAADLAICRGGAGTVAEAWATATPALIMPNPYHRDHHQRANATPLIECGAAIVADDHVEASANYDAHADTLVGLLTEPARCTAMRRTFDALGPADGALQIAQFLYAADTHGVGAAESR